MSRITRKLFLGDISNASSKEWLTSNNIRHVLNATDDIPNYFSDKIQYKKLYLKDVPTQNIESSLDEALEFIVKSSQSPEGGNVLVHCYAGISRSASLVLYFIMRLKNVDYDTALRYLRSRRSIVQPNSGFERTLRKVGTIR